MLEVRNIKYAYNSEYKALKGVSLKVNKGEMVALLGKNGAGKSTLFLHLNGIYQPDEGQVFIDGEELKYDKKIETFEDLENYFFTIKFKAFYFLFNKSFYCYSSCIFSFHLRSFL